MYDADQGDAVDDDDLCDWIDAKDLFIKGCSFLFFN